MNKIFQVAFEISGKLNSSLSAALAAAQNSLNGLSAASRTFNQGMSKNLSALQSQLSKLNQVQAQAKKFSQLNNTIRDNSAALAQARQKASQLNSEHQKQVRQLADMQRAYQRLKDVYKENKSSMDTSARAAMQQQIIQARQELQAQKTRVKDSGGQLKTGDANVDRLVNQLERQKSQLANLRSSLQSAGFSTSSFAASEAKLRSEIESTTRALERQAQISQNRQNFDAASFNLSNSTSNFDAALSTAQTVMNPFKQAVDNAMTFEHAMSRVKALTQTQNIREGNLSQVEADMAKLEGQARELGATTQFTMTQAADAMGYLG